MNAPKPHAEAQARPPKPAECADGCPDQQVCDHCQWPSGPDAEAQAQGGGEERKPDDGKVICPACCHQFRAIPVQVQRDMIAAGFEPPFTAPPTAPVGVVALANHFDSVRNGLPDEWQDFAAEFSRDLRALARQPAPAVVPVDVVREYLDARACHDDATRPPNSHAQAPRLKHGDPVVIRLREARIALDAALAALATDAQEMTMRDDLIERLSADADAAGRADPETDALLREAAAALEAARADAERYRWLRAQNVIAVTSHDQSVVYQRDDLDAEVDRARGKEGRKA